MKIKTLLFGLWIAGSVHLVSAQSLFSIADTTKKQKQSLPVVNGYTEN
jgi:hypothetical protein